MSFQSRAVSLSIILTTLTLAACVSAPPPTAEPNESPVTLSDPNDCGFDGKCSNPGGVESRSVPARFEKDDSNTALEKEAEALRKRQEKRTQQVMEKTKK